MRRRLIVVAVIKNKQDQYLICRMPKNQGLYPGQWGLVGGEVETGEDLEKALVREIWEETQLTTIESKALLFDDHKKEKILADGSREKQYLIYLYFEVLAEGEVKLNEEWEAAQWVAATQLNTYKLNDKTIKLFTHLGLL